MKKIIPMVLIIFIVIIILCVLFLPALIKSRAASQIEKELPSLLGKAESYQVEIHSPLFQLIQGKIEQLKVIGKRVEIKENPVIQNLELNVIAVKVNFKSKKIEQLKTSSFTCLFLEQDLNDYLKNRTKPFPIEDPHLELRENQIYVKGVYPVLFAKVPVDLLASVYVDNGNRVLVRLQSVELSSINVSQKFFGMAEGWVNPLVDLRTMLDLEELVNLYNLVDLNKGNLSVKIDKLIIKPGTLWLKGNFIFPQPSPQPPGKM